MTKIFFAVLLLLALGAGTLAAQSDTPTADPTFRRVALGTAAGAVLGVAVIAGPPTWLAHVQDDHRTSPSDAGIVFGLTAPIGWWLGQSAGASWASGEAGDRVRMRSLLLPAAVWTVAGVFMSARTDGWISIAFPVAALAGTSWSAYQRAHSAQPSDADFALVPTFRPDYGLGIHGSLRLASPW